MADRHHHRHGGHARHTAQPYAGRSSAPGGERVAHRVGGGGPGHWQATASAHVDSSVPPAHPADSGRPHSFNSFRAKTKQAADNGGANHRRTPSQQQKRPSSAGGGGARNDEEEEEEEHDPSKPFALEQDPHRLEQRQKQIAMGQGTPEYAAYLSSVPKESRVRDRRYLDHPVTPPKMVACSKRSWDGQVRKWRRLLHQYDDPTTTGAAKAKPAATDRMQEEEAAGELPPAASTATTMMSDVPAVSSHSAFPALPTAGALAAVVHPSTTSAAPAPSAKFELAHFAAAHQSSSSTATGAPVTSYSSVVAAATGIASASSVAFPPSGCTTGATPSCASGLGAILFTSPATSATAMASRSHASPPAYADRLASFDEEDLALMPPVVQGGAAQPYSESAAFAAAAAHIDEDELVDYEEDTAEEIEMRQQALEAARALH